MRLGYILLAALLPLALLLWACAPPPPPPQPRYELGAAYQAGGTWYYPREGFALIQTGVAAVASERRTGLTANGEAYDPTAMAAGHQTLQLPAIARVTNLVNGAQVLVRINDRGPARPHRILELTLRAAELLDISASGAPIRLEVLEVESRQAIEGLRGAPRLDIAAAPRETVRAESLSGAQPVAGLRPNPVAAETAADAAPSPPRATRLEEVVTRAVSVGPVEYWIPLGRFTRREFSERQRARVAHLNPVMETKNSGRDTIYEVSISLLPNATLAQADALLDQVLRAGIGDARIDVRPIMLR